MNLRSGVNFSHVGFYVWDLEKLTRFYCEVLQFTVTDRGTTTTGGRGIVFLSRNPDEHHEIVLIDGRTAGSNANNIHQISLRVDSLNTLKRFYERFRDAGITDIDSTSHGNAVSFYAPDPEGNRLELFWDTPWYVHQPMRSPVNLTDSVDVLMRTLEESVRRMPGFKSRAEWRAENAKKMGLS